ncbi:DUF6817 domain-containing protein [Serratia plymuthica]|jgi:hypothetical protein|uniref:DUF6817 domain-containing protein n=1 Tax=Serratia plymuthica TaxID=82996 RepID=UPI000456491A|nr:hypothetical protein [Serratia plymuthica]AHY08729.1 hypothetical protein sch_19945 [Serratia plymuthica]MBL3525863.1 hypothetical protein [Serratia plymuthica]MEB6539439.1 hypothetical protein [Serratia plymuthica]RMN21859.1 hypothetical protein ALQ63_03943 [Serratia plymuthica]UNK29389.1 hypothetical protein MNO11_06465 [Serratia plymuthica]
MMETATVVERYQNDFVTLGVHKVAHLDEPLMNHLIRTYEILCRMSCEEQVCLAGLFHGCYGTQGLHTDEIGDIPETQRQIVRNCAGTQVESLVYHFSVMSYESLSKSFRNLLKADGIPALKDRRSGEAITVTREYFEKLLTLKLADVLAHAPTHKNHTCTNIPAQYGAFWEMVAEYFGGNKIRVWNEIVS